MYRIISFVLASALTTVGAAAFAKPNETPKAPAPAVEVKRDADGTVKYCIALTQTGSETTTGSILPRRGCRTREEWADRGVVLKKR